MEIEEKLPDMQPMEMDFLLNCSAANEVSIKDTSTVEVSFALEEKESLEEAAHAGICLATFSKPISTLDINSCIAWPSVII